VPTPGTADQPEKTLQVHQALWWISEGLIPTVSEGKQKLDYLQQHGPGETAFTFAKPHIPSDAS